MTIFQTSHASYLRVVYEIFLIEKLFDWLYSLGQKITLIVMFSLAILTVRSKLRWTFVDHMTPFVALIADCLLRTSVSMMISWQAEQARSSIRTGEVMMTQFFASEASNIILEVTIWLPFNLLVFLLFIRTTYFLPEKGDLSLCDFLEQVGCLCLSGDIWTGDLIGMYGDIIRSSSEEIITVNGHDGWFVANFLHNVIEDA